MERANRQEIEAVKAKKRVDFYLAGGSRIVYASRWVVSAILVLFWLVIWWRGAW